jgi:integrase
VLQAFLTRRLGRSGPRDPGELPILTALENYGREHAPTTAAPERIAYAIDALLPFWSGRMVADITRETCRAYGRDRARAPGTIRRELGMLRASINHEVREGRLTRPVTVWLPPKPDGKDRWLTRSEFAGLLRAGRRDKRCRLYLPLFCLIGLYTGARKGAILSLRWPQVDLDRARIDFNSPGLARTSKGRPIIPIPRGLLWFLRKARERGSELGYVVNRDGRRIKDVKRSFPTACRRAGLAGVTPHTLRHTAGTWMAQRAVPLWEIAGYLGQTHERTAAIYSHHSPDHLARAREALD